MMQKSQQFNFYQNGESIKNHMVEYLASAGSVSKTLFGIELGSVCKTPNRGRTKLLLETYPNLFHDDGERITLCTSSSVSSPVQSPTRCQSPTVIKSVQVDTQPSESLSNSQQYFVPLQPQAYRPSASNESLGYSSVESMWDPSYWYPPTPPAFPSPPPSYYQMYSPMQSYDGSMELSQMPASQPLVMYQQQGVEVGNVVIQEEEVRCGELCTYQPPQEVMALEILNSNNGAMEVSQLMQAMGVAPTDQIGQANLYEFLSRCPSIVIQDGMAQIHQVPSYGESGQDATGEYGEDATPEEPQCSHSGEIPHQSNDDEVNDDLKDQEKENEQGGDEGSNKQGDFPEIGAKTIRVGQIHIGNINIQTVNLHMHVDDMKSSQVSDLVGLQQMMQEMFSRFNMAK